MRALVLTYLITSAVMAEPAGLAVHHIEADGSYRPPGRPLDRPYLYAVAGKPLELRWPVANPGGPVAVRVDRVTDSRRLAVAAGDVTLSETGWVWIWKPPVARGAAHYEVRLDGHPELTVRVETRDPEWLENMKSSLSRTQWEAVGLTPLEKNALAALGLKISQASDQPRDGPAVLRMIPPGASGGRREVVWDKREPDSVVWSADSAAGDWRVRAPQWWLSPEALETDQGLIRFLELFFEAPNKP